jgi:hypothetical protein
MNQTTSDQKIGISLFDIVGLDYGQADSINNTVKKRLNINMNYQNEEGLLISQMTPTELEAYKACLGSKDSITLSFTGNAAVDDTVFLKVDYHPPESNETKPIVVTTTQGKLSGTTTDVKISGKGKTATGKIQANSIKPLQIERDVFKPMSIVVSIGSGSKSIDLPARPRRTFKRDILNSLQVINYASAPTYVDATQESCVKIPDNVDGIIVPGTVRMKWSDYIVSKASIKETVSYSEIESCIKALFHYSVVGQDEALKAKGVASATILKAVPVTNP